MKYCLFTKNGLEKSTLVQKIVDVLLKDTRFQKDDNNPELVIVIGGDGTFLKAAQTVFPKNEFARFLCFNAGTIGFYHDFDESDVEKIPSIVFEEKYPLGEIDALETKIGGKDYYAFNEFNLTGLSQNIDYDIKIDGEFLEHFFGAGIIISTVTGSTAYNRSLNGALLDTTLHVIEITEVAGIHSRSHKTVGNSIVISEKRTIQFRNASSRKGYLYADGFKITPTPIEELCLRLGKKKLLCYVKKKDNFVDRIHKTIDL